MMRPVQQSTAEHAAQQFCNHSTCIDHNDIITADSQFSGHTDNKMQSTGQG